MSDQTESGFRYKRMVNFHETDLAGIVHFSWFFRYMEEAEHALWRAAGLRVDRAGSNIGWPRVSATFDFQSPLRYEDNFEVTVRIDAVTRRTIRFAFVMVRGDTRIGNGALTVVCAHRQPDGRMESTDVPADVATQLRAAAGQNS